MVESMLPLTEPAEGPWFVVAAWNGGRREVVYEGPDPDAADKAYEALAGRYRTTSVERRAPESPA